ncbi:MAG: PIN domain-containing protein [Polaromonas sp.]|nr:PIN domain-containing protein [Polaromonas sp.]
MNAATRSTPGGVFVDAAILIYSEDGADPTKQQAALAWLDVLWRRGMGCISAQVLNEFYVTATCQLTPPMPAGDARAEVRRYELWQPWQIDHATVESAWALESRFGLGYADCLVVAAAQHLGCRYLLSEDLAHEQHYGAVQVINPFKTSVDVLATL